MVRSKQNMPERVKFGTLPINLIDGNPQKLINIMIVRSKSCRIPAQTPYRVKIRSRENLIP